MKLGLVLDGGGGKGAYQIGVWKAMREFGLDTQVKAIAGTSVGGLNAALFVQGDFDLAYWIWSKEIRRIHGMEMQKNLSELIDDYIDFSKIMESPIDCFLATYCPFQTGEYLNCNNDRNIPESLVHGEMTYYNLRMISQKCQTCPYKQGLIKAKLDPCIQCKASSRKTHPFPMPVEIHEGEICAKCGSNRFVNGKCAVCGAKLRRKLF